MNEAIELLEACHRMGVELRVVEGRVWYRPASAVGPELRERLRAHKAELLVLLTVGPHEPGLSERIMTGHTPAGWGPKAWARRLLDLSERFAARGCSTLSWQCLRWAGSVLTKASKARGRTA